MSVFARADIVVIGAGPGGLHAALAATRAGARVIVIDEQSQPGGQYFKQPLLPYGKTDETGGQGRALIEEARIAGVQFMLKTSVVGQVGTAPITLAVRDKNGISEVSASSVIVATGAYDRVIAFPGWDLPGVVTAGGAQSLAKASSTAFRGRVVLAGSGPFLMPVARTLVKAGTDLAGIFELGRPTAWLKHASRLLGHPGRLFEMAGYAAFFLRKRVPFHFGWRVVRAEGDGALERVVVARCNNAGEVFANTEKPIAADVLCIGYGFVASSQVSAHFGCRHRFDRNAGGWIVEHDDMMRTSVPGVFVAGEAAGIGGMECARAEGRIAGLTAAGDLGFRIAPSDLRDAKGARKRHRRFAALVRDVFPLRERLYDEIGGEVLICRCEEVSAADVLAVCEPWTRDVNTVKAASRCGLGRCQARICGHHLAELISRKTALPVEELGLPSVRMPLQPVTAGEIANWPR